MTEAASNTPISQTPASSQVGGAPAGPVAKPTPLPVDKQVGETSQPPIKQVGEWVKGVTQGTQPKMDNAVAPPPLSPPLQSAGDKVEHAAQEQKITPQSSPKSTRADARAGKDTNVVQIRDGQVVEKQRRSSGRGSEKLTPPTEAAPKPSTTSAPKTQPAAATQAAAPVADQREVQVRGVLNELGTTSRDLPNDLQLLSEHLGKAINLSSISPKNKAILENFKGIVDNLQKAAEPFADNIGKAQQQKDAGKLEESVRQTARAFQATGPLFEAATDLSIAYMDASIALKQVLDSKEGQQLEAGFQAAQPPKFDNTGKLKGPVMMRDYLPKGFQAPLKYRTFCEVLRKNMPESAVTDDLTKATQDVVRFGERMDMRKGVVNDTPKNFALFDKAARNKPLSDGEVKELLTFCENAGKLGMTQMQDGKKTANLVDQMEKLGRSRQMQKLINSDPKMADKWNAAVLAVSSGAGKAEAPEKAKVEAANKAKANAVKAWPDVSKILDVVVVQGRIPKNADLDKVMAFFEKTKEDGVNELPIGRTPISVGEQRDNFINSQAVTARLRNDSEFAKRFTRLTS